MKRINTNYLYLLIIFLGACSGQPREEDQASTPVPEIDVAAAVTPEERKQAHFRHSPLMKEKKQVLSRLSQQMHYEAFSPISPYTYPSQDRENYAHFENQPVKRTAEAPVSTFSIDVDTASFSNVRRMLNQGRLPLADAVRVEELINYFDYQYPYPDKLDTPFRVHTEIAPTPWNKKSHLLHVGIKAYQPAMKKMPATNLVFLVDVSGSMHSADKLPLLKQSMKLLVNQMRAKDRISMVVYAGSTGIILEPTAGNQKLKISHAIEKLSAGGSTNGASGIQLAYQMAEQGFIKGGINRILLATDGDFNVGVTSFEALINMVEQKRANGVGLSTLGFGSGNLNDRLLEQLSNKGNGAYYYIDTLREANKVLVEEVRSSLMTVAKDTKIQLEFNPNIVSEYRLIGYENRALKREDFNNDKVDAGDVGAGHTVTALYEITFKGKAGRIEPLRYGLKMELLQKSVKQGELGFLRLRYKKAGQDKSQLVEKVIHRKDILSRLSQASTDFRFAASVAAFGQILRGGQYTESFTLKDVHELAANNRGQDRYGYRGEFLGLVRLAESLSPQLSENQTKQIQGKLN
ncbi:MAG: VWA domain-containing protein [Gammaproteobacteria bacterium]|nr:VWA domain-containing protein [Gammaproteobacteria bacterium]